MPSESSRLPNEIRTRLARVESQIKTFAIVRGCAWTCLVLCIGTLFAMLMDWCCDISVPIRAAYLIVLCGAMVVVTWQCVCRPCFAHFSDAQLAALVERVYPDLKEELISTVELTDPTLPNEFKGSALMRELLCNKTYRDAISLDYSQVVSSDRATRLVFGGIVGLVIVLSPFLFVPTTYRLMWSRFLMPWGNFDRVGAYRFDIPQGDRVVARGADVTIQARLQSVGDRIPETVWIRWTDSTDIVSRRRMELDNTTGTYQSTFRQVVGSFRYAIEAGQSRSKTYHIRVVEPPELLATRLRVEPPGYLGVPARTIDGIVGETVVFERSRLTFYIQFNKPMTSGVFQWLSRRPIASTQEEEADADRDVADTLPFELSDDRLSGQLTMTATTNGAFILRAVDEYGLENASQPERLLTIIEDQPPQLALAGSEEPEKAQPTDIFPIEALATDDVGVGALELHCEVFEGETRRFPSTTPALGTRSVSDTFRLDLAELNLTHGSVVTCRVRAADERPVPGPNEVWSKPRMILIDRDARPPGTDRILDRQNDLKKQLEDIRRALSKDREHVDDVLQTAKRAEQDKTDFKRDDELSIAAREQSELARRLDELARRLAEDPLLSNLVPDMQQLSREALPDIAKELSDAAKQPLTDKTHALQNASNELAQAEEELKRMADRFDELAELERDLLELERLAQHAHQLADRAGDLDEQWKEALRQLSEEARKDREEQLTAKRQDLQTQQQDLSDELKDLLERRPEVVDAAKRHELDRLADLARQANAIAEPEDRLADSLKESAAQDAAASESNENKHTDTAKTQPGESSDAGNDPRSATNADGPTSEAQTTSAPSSPTNETPDAEDALARQQALTRDAARLALDIAEQQGPTSDATQSAMQTAGHSQQASQSVQAGRFSQAEQAAREAVDTAEQMARQLDQPQSSRNGLNERVRELTERQQQLADQYRRLSESATEKQKMQQRNQEQLAAAADRLAEQLADAAERLSGEPLKMQSEGDGADAARQAADQSHDAMKESLNQIATQEPGQAEPTAREAAQAMRQAAQLAAAAAGHADVKPSPVPPDAAKDVAEAARQLQQAQQQLSQSGQQGQPSGEPQKSDNASQQSNSQQGQDAAGSRNQNSPLSESAQSLQQAAQSLSQAANQLQPGQPQSGKNANRKADSVMPNADSLANSADGSSGTGARNKPDLKDLDVALKKLARRDWGQLPGKLRTEILQAAKKRPNGEYAKLIQLYFEEIARTRIPLDDSESTE